MLSYREEQDEFPGGNYGQLPPPQTHGLELVSAAITAMPGTISPVSTTPLLQSVQSIAAAGLPPGVSAELDEGQIEIQVSADASPGTSTLTITGAGCEYSCGLAFTAQVTLTITPLKTATAGVEQFSAPSADRTAEAVDEHLADELLVTLGTPEHPGTLGEAKNLAGAVGAVASGGLADIGVYEFRWASPQGLAARSAELEHLAGVTDVALFSLESYGDDAAIPVPTALATPQWTWPYERVNAPEAWDLSTGSYGATVAVIDEGNVLDGHEDLPYALLDNRAGVAYKPEDHATQVAGLACGDGRVGAVGLAWGCPLISARVGKPVNNAFVLQAMREMTVGPSPRVVNVSLGTNVYNGAGEEVCANESQAMDIMKKNSSEDAMFRHVLEGPGKKILWTFSAGNSCMPGPNSPWGVASELPNVITTAAGNSDGTLARFSDYGVGVNVAAPGGVAVGAGLHEWGPVTTSLPCTPGGFCVCVAGKCEYEWDYGTSFAAPIVAGIAADAMTAAFGASASEVGACIKETAGSGTVGLLTEQSGSPDPGRFKPAFPFNGSIPVVNAASAIRCVKKGGVGGRGGPEPCRETWSPDKNITLAGGYRIRGFPRDSAGLEYPCGTVGELISGDGSLMLFQGRSMWAGEEVGEQDFEELASGRTGGGEQFVSGASDDGSWSGSLATVFNTRDPSNAWTVPTPSDMTGVLSYDTQVAAISDDGNTAVYWVQGTKGSASGTFLFYAKRGGGHAVQLSEGESPWTFYGSVSADGRYIAWHDDGGSNPYPRLLDTTTGKRENIVENENFLSAYISSDGKRILLSDFFGDASWVERGSKTLHEIPVPLDGVSPNIEYLVTYVGSYDCPEALDEYNLESATLEPVLKARNNDCSLSRGPGFSAANLLIDDSGSTLIWNSTVDLATGDNNGAPDAYIIQRETVGGATSTASRAGPAARPAQSKQPTTSPLSPFRRSRSAN